MNGNDQALMALLNARSVSDDLLARWLGHSDALVREIASVEIARRHLASVGDVITDMVECGCGTGLVATDPVTRHERNARHVHTPAHVSWVTRER